MEYPISKTKRNLLIFSAILLILKAIIVIIIFYFRESAHQNNTLSVILSTLQIILFGYILIVIAGYFNHYKLKSLRTITLVLLILDIAGIILQYFNRAEMNVPKFVTMGSGILWTLILIVWIIFLVRTTATDFPALISIRKYAISVLAVILISGTLPFLIGKIINIQQYLGIIVVVIGVIPYFFIIEFGLKLPGKD